MTEFTPFSTFQSRHFRRRTETACGVRLRDLAPTDSTRNPLRVDCTACLEAMEDDSQ